MPQTTSQSMLAMISLSLLYTQSTAQNDGMWSASSAVVPEVSAPVVTSAAYTSAAAPVDWQTAVTWPAGCETWLNPCPAGAVTSGSAPTAAAVTWPAGCETWANPCPASAIVSAAVATAAPESWSSASDYTNGFTSYTTMTNSNGIITGMPPKATIASGASSVLADQSSMLASQQTTLSTIVTPSSVVASPSFASASSSETADFSFAQSSASATSAPYEGAASSRCASTVVVLMVAGVAGLIMV